MNKKSTKKQKQQKQPNPAINLIKSQLSDFKFALPLLFLISVLASGLNIYFPFILSKVIDEYTKSSFDWGYYLSLLAIICLLILGVSIYQVILSNQISEKFAYKLRQTILNHLNVLPYSKVEEYGNDKIYTNFTSDIDKSKEVITTVFVSVLSAILLLVGSMVMLFVVDWRLAFISLFSLPIIMVVFGSIFSKVSKYFYLSQQNLDGINKVISENVAGASLIRVLNSKNWEVNKFDTVNLKAQNISQNIVKLFATLIPIVNLISVCVTILILYFGGVLIVNNSFSIGSLNAFISYYALLIQPIFILGFVASFISSSFISLNRINAFLEVKPDLGNTENLVKELITKIEFKSVYYTISDKNILNDISFVINKNTKNALVGPVGAGKSQIFYLLAGLIKPTTGTILINDQDIANWDKTYLRENIGIVFQDSIIFNDTIKKNIIFDNNVSDIDFNNAVNTSIVNEFVEKLDNKYETVIDERGTNLSGGQKQRLTLARSLVLKPQLLLLDDFTARVDFGTEQKIVNNLSANYPDLILISITQKIEPIKNYDQIIFIMEGQLVGKGTHEELIKESVDYKQIIESQKTIN